MENHHDSSLFHFFEGSIGRAIARLLVVTLIFYGIPAPIIGSVYADTSTQDPNIFLSGDSNCIENLAVRAKTGKIQLAWTHVPGTTEYKIQRSLSLTDPFAQIGTTQSDYSTFLDESVENDTIYYYKIEKIADTGDQCLSNTIAAVAPSGRIRMTTVPNIIGQTESQAEEILIGSNLSIGVVNQQASDSVPFGETISQDPPPDSVVPRGNTVDITISSGATPVLVDIPDLLGQTQVNAEATLVASNLTVGTVTTQNSDTIPAGIVISQSPVGGTLVALGTAVDFVVSLGPVTVVTPNVVGLDQSSAETAITAADLAVGTVTTQNSDTVPAGVVISQSPVAGTSVVLGTAVDLVVSLGPVTVAVPDVVGQNQGSAEAAITAASLVVGIVTTQNSDTVPAGNVISQSPLGGTLVIFSTPVDLVVSLGPVTVAVPDVVGQVQASAEVAITAASLVVGTVTTQNSDTVPAGNVISQSPVGGTSVVLSTAIDLVVSLGPVTVAVPDVVGQDLASAEAAITAASLTVGTITNQNSDTVPLGVVISQSPIAGTSVVLSTAVDLVISLGPVTVAVPDVVGQDQASAEAAITAASLTVGTIINQISDTVPVGVVISQSPTAGTSVVLGTAIDMVVSLGPFTVVVPDVVGQDQVNAEAAITAASLVVGVITTQNSDTMPVGDVISQSPIGGTLVILSTPVDLVVSLGPVTVAVPDVVGQDQASAEAAITAASLTVGTITNQNSDTVPVGVVISQSPTAGTSVVLGTAVDLVISLGPFTVAVPDVVGQDQASAEAAITATSLVVGVVTTQNSDTIPAGDVISQSPAAGTVVALGTAVDLVVSLGPVAIVDNLRPAVILTVDPPTVNVGETVTITVEATDDVGIVSTQLLVNGAEVLLDASGIATFSSPTAGVFTAEATTLDAAGHEGYASESFRFLTPGDTTPPTVSLNAPTEFTELTEPTDIIGTASDANLTRYVLEYSVKDQNNFLAFSSGSIPISAGILGRFDTSMLRNGLYDVRLTAEDTSGNVAMISHTYKVSGEAKIGNFTLDFTDLSIPVSGIPITITRTYDSRVKSSDDFGNGWSLNVNNIEVSESGILGDDWQQTSSGFIFTTFKLEPTKPHFVTVTFPDGRTDEFNMQINPNSSSLLPVLSTTASFTAAPGTFSSLTSLANNSLSVSILGVTGPVDLLSNFSIYDPDRYQLNDVDGTQYVLNQNTGIESLTDPNGNIVTFGTDGIIHSAGKSVTFTRDAQGRITAITDPNGNNIQYEYDFYGDLVSVTDREGNITRYGYNSNHGLIEITDPLGRIAARNEYDADGRLISVTDENGRTINFEHDPNTRQEVIRDADGNISVLEYDANGNVIRTTDPLGGITTNTYDADGNQTSTTNPLGNTTFRTFDAQGNQLTETDPFGNTRSFTYNARNQVLTRTDQNGNTTSLTYDASGNLLTQFNALGVTETTNTYDASGNLLTTTDPLGRTTTYERDAFGNYTATISPDGSRKEYTYDANGNLVSDVDGRGSRVNTINDARGLFIEKVEALGNVARFQHDAFGQLVAVEDQLGNSFERVLDRRGNETQFTDALGNVTQREYNFDGNLIEEIDPLGNRTNYSYNPLGNLLATVQPDGSSVQTEYDLAGRPIRKIDENGNPTDYEYDALGRNTRIIDALGNQTLFEYDAVGNLIRTTDALGNVYQTTYDALNQITQITYPDGSIERFDYDAAGQVTRVTDPAGRITQYEYNPMGRIARITDPLGYAYTYAYNATGNLKTITDANGHTTERTYDINGRLSSIIRPDGSAEQFAYDAAGRMVGYTDPNGSVTQMEYDALGQVVAKNFADGSRREYTYRHGGQVATITDDRGVTRYSYDSRDRVIQIENPDGSELRYTYDAVGNRTSVTTQVGPAAPERTTTYGYDALNRLSTVTDESGNVTRYNYDAQGNRSQVEHANGVVTSYTYDALKRLVQIEHRQGIGGSLLDRFDYTVDLVGNRIRTDRLDGSFVDYEYDLVSRLTKETHWNDLGQKTLEYSYTYDAVGNRLSRMDLFGNITNYTHDVNDRLITAGAVSFTYDANGNTLTRVDAAGTTFYDYDAENRLVEVTSPSAAVTQYVYDGKGNRVSKMDASGMISYLADPEDNTGYAQVLEEYDPVSRTINVSYVYGDDLLTQERSGIVSTYLHDGSNSVRMLTDATGAITDTYDFDAFGNLTASTGTTLNHYLFSGEQLDPNSGFYYLRARYYSPETGRFITPDPFRGYTSDPMSLHKYAYANNNPNTFTDPSGNVPLLAIPLLKAMLVSGLASAAISVAFDLVLGERDFRKIVWSAGAAFIFGAITGGIGHYVHTSSKLASLLLKGGKIHYVLPAIMAFFQTAQFVTTEKIKNGAVPDWKIIGVVFAIYFVVNIAFLKHSVKLAKIKATKTIPVKPEVSGYTIKLPKFGSTVTYLDLAVAQEALIVTFRSFGIELLEEFTSEGIAVGATEILEHALAEY